MERRASRTTKKGGLLGIIEEAELARKLVKETHFTEREVNSLIKIYKQFLRGPTMDKSTYVEMLHNSLGMMEEFFMERVFFAADIDKDGSVSLEEFIRSLSIMLRGTISEKIPFCFAAFDLRDAMQITRDDICVLLKQSLMQEDLDEDPLEGILDMVEIFLKKMELQTDGVLTYEEYKSAVEKDFMLLEVFGPVLPDNKSASGFLAMFSEVHPYSYYQ